jgi:hypothetical protein
MAISFRCPNGHRLTCPDERAGQAGKCPKCGAVFHVPTQQEAEGVLVGVAVGEEAAAAGSSGVRVGEGSGPAHGDSPSGIRAGSDVRSPETKAETIVFLCPQGHKLNAPIRLQGKPGKCPHCGEKFLVPLLEEEESVSDSGSFLGSLSNYAPVLAPPEPQPVVHAPEPHESGFNFSGLAVDDFTAGLNDSSSQAMANLFAHLWSQRGETGVVELYLKGGEILSPHSYAPQLSQQAYGMFAFQETDGSHTLTAVHWDAIERIALRGLPELPSGIFEP